MTPGTPVLACGEPAWEGVITHISPHGLLTAGGHGTLVTIALANGQTIELAFPGNHPTPSFGNRVQLLLRAAPTGDTE